MSILIGLFCGTFAVILFSSGVFAGWKLHGIVNHIPKPVEQPPLTDEQKERIERVKQEEEVFRIMQNYDSDTAYGVSGSETL